MRTLVITFLYIYFFSLPHAVPQTYVPAYRPISQADLSTWVCRYNVGPSADLTNPKTLAKCHTYGTKVHSAMTALNKLVSK